MSSYHITCDRCEAPVTHECRRWKDYNPETKEALWREEQAFHPNPVVHAFIELLNWKPEGGLPKHNVEAMKKSDWYSPGDEDAPFLSQSIIYPLLDWKDNARALFALFHAVMAAAGLDYLEVRKLANRIRTKKDERESRGVGGLIRTSELKALDWKPDTGWTVGVTGHGIGIVTATVSEVMDDGSNRGDQSLWIKFVGGGRYHFRRLLRIAHWVKDADGNDIWSVEG